MGCSMTKWISVPNVPLEDLLACEYREHPSIRQVEYWSKQAEDSLAVKTGGVPVVIQGKMSKVAMRKTTPFEEEPEPRYIITWDTTARDIWKGTIEELERGTKVLQSEREARTFYRDTKSRLAKTWDILQVVKA